MTDQTPSQGRNTWTGLDELPDRRRIKTIDEWRTEYFQQHFPRLGEWIMEEGDGTLLLDSR